MYAVVEARSWRAARLAELPLTAQEQLLRGSKSMGASCLQGAGAEAELCLLMSIRRWGEEERRALCHGSSHLWAGGCPLGSGEECWLRGRGQEGAGAWSELRRIRL